MTIRRFGRVTRIQMTMLRLVGYRLSRAEATLAIPNDERVANMVIARKNLCQLTGADFEYDLLGWHRFLKEHTAYGYTHPFAFAGVEQAVREGASDTKRAILMMQIRAIEKSAVPIPRFGLLTPSQLAMLGLIGYRLSPTESSLAIPDDERLNHILSAHHRLCEMTDIDLGYDVSAWHLYLMEHENYGYTYPYAVDLVAQAVRGSKADKKKRRALISRL